MKVLEEAMDQCLLCMDYAFDQDSPSNREVARNHFQPGATQKDWWRYHHTYLGLKTLVAYEGARAVGHIEFMPIEHAPRAVVGQNLMFINCLYVAPEARGRGVGTELLASAERLARSKADGMTVEARWSGPVLPAHFFIAFGYQPVASRSDAALLNKPFGRAHTPRFLPARYSPRREEERIAVDYFHCAQCPYSGWVLQQLKREGMAKAPDVDLRVINTCDRQAVEQWGVANAVFVDGRPAADVPLNLLDIEKALVRARSSRPSA